jgi:hypothetical protein
MCSDTHARLFISGTLFQAVSVDTHRHKDQPAAFTPRMLIEQHAAHLDYLSGMYQRTHRRFSLTHLLGAVKREYGTLRYLPEEQTRTDEEWTSSAMDAIATMSGPR